MQEPFKLIVREEFFKFSLYMFSKILTDQNSLNHLGRGSLYQIIFKSGLQFSTRRFFNVFPYRCSGNLNCPWLKFIDGSKCFNNFW